MKQFLKSQFTSIVATTVDFLTTVILSEVFSITYLRAHVIGMISGGTTQFLMNKLWTFSGSQQRFNMQLFRFLAVWLVGLGLNTFCVWVAVQYFQIHYLIAKVLVSAFLAVSVNFYLQKNYVFKR